MKKKYMNPQLVVYKVKPNKMLAISWGADSRGGIDPNPGTQDDFGVKGNNTDSNAPWYKH